MKKFLVLAALLLAATGMAPGRVYAAKVSSTVAFDSRQLVTTLWYPDKLAVIRGLIVFTGGASGTGSGDTRGMVNSAFWQRFAENVGFGLVGDQFTGSYANAAAGPGQALLDSIAQLASASNHPELVHAPLLVEGFSNGGYFSFTFAQFMPARVIAFCLNKSGFANAPFDAAFLSVPGLLIWGSEEPTTGVPTIIHTLAQQGRAQHALWAELKEWGARHEEGSAELVFAPFFADMISARYPAGVTPVARDVPLIALNENNGWLGDVADASLNSALPTIARVSSYAGDKTIAAWLPSEAIANLWRGFVTQTPLDLTAPSGGAQFDASQALRLSVTGLVSGQSASFLDGSAVLVASVPANAGAASTTWSPGWGGPRGIVALAVDAQGVVQRTSRPVNIVLYGKPSPADSAIPAARTWTLALIGLALTGYGLRRLRVVGSRATER